MIEQLAPLTPEYYDAVWCIEQRAHAFPWAESMIRKDANQLATNFVWLVEGEVVGYLYGQNVVGEVTILNVAVDPKHQGKGYGKKLLLAFMDAMKAAKGEEIWLEVRESNTRAAQLYESLGFNEINRRAGYYPTAHGREDALVMTYFIF